MGGFFSSETDWSKEYLAGYSPSRSGDLSLAEMRRTIDSIDSRAVQRLFDKYRGELVLFRLYQFLRHPKGVGNEYVLVRLKKEEVLENMMERYEEIMQLWNRLPMNCELFKMWSVLGWPAVERLLQMQRQGADDSALYEAFPEQVDANERM